MSRTIPQVTVDHNEYQELLEAEKALKEIISNPGKNKVIEFKTEYTRSHGERTTYIISNPSSFQKELIEQLVKFNRHLEDLHEKLGSQYNSKGIFGKLDEIHKAVVPKK